VQGPVEEGVLRQVMALRAPIPKKFAEAPDIPLGLDMYLEAFWDLSSCRSAGWGVGPIPWTAILDYAHAYGLDPEQTEDLVYYVRVLDKAYIEHSQRQQGK
jgi:hypothetical protein